MADVIEVLYTVHICAATFTVDTYFNQLFLSVLRTDAASTSPFHNVK